MTVTVERDPYEHLCVKGLQAGWLTFCVKGDGELLQVIQALTEAGGFYVHQADGCEDDGCPCRQRAQSQKQAR
jgi:hypothetical protein